MKSFMLHTAYHETLYRGLHAAYMLSLEGLVCSMCASLCVSMTNRDLSQCRAGPSFSFTHIFMISTMRPVIGEILSSTIQGISCAENFEVAAAVRISVPTDI